MKKNNLMDKDNLLSISDNVSIENNKELKELANRYELDFLESVSSEMLDPELVENLAVEWARSNCLLPIRINGETCILTDDPNKICQQEYLSLLIGEDLRIVITSRDIILSCIEKCYCSRNNSPEEFMNDMKSSGQPETAKRINADDLLQVAEKAPVTQLINLILLEAVKRNASDIHFEPFESKLQVRYRIDGVLYKQSAPPKHLEEALVSRLKVMARLDIAEKRLPQDGMAKVKVGEREIDIRMSTVPVAEGERIVLRLLDRDSALLPLSTLGMSENLLTSFLSLLSVPNGMIIVSGPTGSGKTTTLYAVLSQFDAIRKNIITIEDPIEYQLQNIGQIQVKPKIGLTFTNGLRHILRQDPDIILVGETRDIETAEISIRASLTGHLVFTTLHTNDTAGAVLRLMDMGIEPYLLAGCIRGVLAQRLVRKLCRKCKKETVVSDFDINDSKTMADLNGKTIWMPSEGCSACVEGYSGRIGIFELMVIDKEMQNLLRMGHSGIDSLCDFSRKRGMVSMHADGINKILAGMTSLPEILNVTDR